MNTPTQQIVPPQPSNQVLPAEPVNVQPTTFSQPMVQNVLPTQSQNYNSTSPLPKEKGNFRWVLIIFTILILILAGYILYTLIQTNSTNNQANTDTTNTNNEAISNEVVLEPKLYLDWLKIDNSIPKASDAISTNGRLAEGQAGKGDTGGVFHPHIIKVGDKFKMWYEGSIAAGVGTIFYAESDDMLTWEKYDNSMALISDSNSTNGRIPLGTAGTGDSYRISMPSVLVDKSGIYQMWYGGFDGTNWRIFHATSPDGLTWTKTDNSIPSASDTTSTNGRIANGTAGTADEKQASAPQVIFDEEEQVYKMWYSTVDPGYILMATSLDGLTWTKVNNDIPTPSNTTSTGGRIPQGLDGSGDEIAARNPSVIKLDGRYHMWYVGVAVEGLWQNLFYAYSDDGLEWNKYDNSEVDPLKHSNGVSLATGSILHGGYYSGDEGNFGAPAVFLEGKLLRMFYHSNNILRDSNPDKTIGRIYSVIEFMK